MTDEQVDRTKEYADRMLALLSRVRRYHSALSDIAAEAENGASTMSDIARKALRAESLNTDVLSADLHWARDLDRMVEELTKTIWQSVILEQAKVEDPLHEGYAAATKEGLKQAAKQIATSIEEYGR